MESTASNDDPHEHRTRKNREHRRRRTLRTGTSSETTRRHRHKSRSATEEGKSEASVEQIVRESETPRERRHRSVSSFPVQTHETVGEEGSEVQGDTTLAEGSSRRHNSLLKSAESGDPEQKEDGVDEKPKGRRKHKSSGRLSENESNNKPTMPEQDTAAETKSKHRTSRRHRSDRHSRSRGRKTKREDSDEKTTDRDDERESGKENRTENETDQLIEDMFSEIGRTEEDFKGDILSVIVHRADALRPNVRLVHPAVKVHFVDATTGLHIKKSEKTRPVTSFLERSQVDYILPIMTPLFDLGRHGTLAPSWEHELVLNEDYLYLVQENVLVLLEVLDVRVPVKEDRGIIADGWHRVAYAFFMLVGGNGKTNTEKKVRLQLYEYPSKMPTPASSVAGGPPYVWKCWKGIRKRYPSTLYISVRSRPMLTSREVTERPIFPTEIEKGKMTFEQLIESTRIHKRAPVEGIYASIMNLSSEKHTWRRIPGQKCELPNKLLMRLDAGSQGCTALAFSNNGLLLAAACCDPPDFPIKIFDAMTGERVFALEGHQDLIYEISWSETDEEILSASSDGSARIWRFMEDNTARTSAIFQHPCFVYTAQFHPQAIYPRMIVSGSFDHLVRLWQMPMESSGMNTPLRKFDSVDDDRSVNTLRSTKLRSPQPFTKPTQVLHGHAAHVNCLVIEKNGERIYSGDAAGMIRVWSCRTRGIDIETLSDSEAFSNYECIKNITLLEGFSVHSLALHPNGRTLVAHAQGDTVQAIDLRLHRFVAEYVGPEKHVARGAVRDAVTVEGSGICKSVYTPCGTWICTGQEDGKVRINHTDSTLPVGCYVNRAALTQPVTSIAFHPLDNYVAFAAFGDSQPVLIYIFDVLEERMEHTKTKLLAEKYRLIY